MEQKTRRPLEELRQKARLAMYWPELVWAAREGSSPTALDKMGKEMRGEQIGRAARWMGIIRRDCGVAKFEIAVSEANAYCMDNKDPEERVRRFACLHENDKKQEWMRWTQLGVKARTLPKDVLAFLPALYDWCDEEGDERYEHWGLQPYDQAAYELFWEHITDASNQEILDLLEIGMRPDGADPSAFDKEVRFLRERRPAVDLCVGAIKNVNVLFDEVAWELLQEYYESGHITPEAWRVILADLAEGRGIKSDEIQAAAEKLLAELTAADGSGNEDE